MTPITRFRGKYHFLSNFYIEADGKALEHRFQAEKTDDVTWKERILAAPTPAEAKRLGQLCPMQPGWNAIRLNVMLWLVTDKFSDLTLQNQLLATRQVELIEGNSHGDTFWGQCPLGVGENYLGRILMDVRGYYRRLHDATHTFVGR